MSRGDWYEPKDQIDHSHGKRVAGGTREETTHKEESHNWKMLQWVKILFIILIFSIALVPKS